MTPGFFLVVEGPDGSGKSTLAAGLAERMREAGLDPILVRQPGGTPAAERIREAFLDSTVHFEPQTELLYICAARAHLVQEVIRPALAAGRIVISDRYELSTHAYQGAGRGLDRQTVALVNGVATGGLRPHLTLVLDIPPDVGLRRQQQAGKVGDRLERADPAFHRSPTLPACCWRRSPTSGGMSSTSVRCGRSPPVATPFTSATVCRSSPRPAP